MRAQRPPSFVLLMPSSFGDRDRCNNFSIRIELKRAYLVPYTPDHYRVLAATSLDILSRFPAITPERIVGHSTIAPGRKTDPGPAFDWELYRGLLAADIPGARTLD